MHWHPEFALLMVKIDLQALNIDREEAAFIDLDIAKPLNLEIMLNMQRLVNMTPDLLQ